MKYADVICLLCMVGVFYRRIFYGKDYFSTYLTFFIF